MIISIAGWSAEDVETQFVATVKQVAAEVKREHGDLAKKGLLTKQQLGAHFRNCDVTPPETIVIQFEGTSNYDPIQSELLRRTQKRLQTMSASPDDQKVAELMNRELDELKGTWSGLHRGATTQILLGKESRGSKEFFSFPSEEFHLPLYNEGINAVSPAAGTLLPTMAGVPLMLPAQSAQKCLNQMLAKVPAGKPRPKIVVMGYSSGAMAALKFARLLEEQRTPVDLMFTIDPVHEAHLAATGAAADLMKEKILRSLLCAGSSQKIEPTVIQADAQKFSPIPTNVKKWVNAYQDYATVREGIPATRGIPIPGLPIPNNLRIMPDSESNTAEGHGTIAYHPLVIERLRKELKNM